MKEYEVKIMPSADSDMEGIFSYISEELNDKDAAIKLMEKIYKVLKALKTSPKRYSLSKDKFLSKQGFRIIPLANYLIFYIVDDIESIVLIHRVIYSKRNYPALFVQS